MAQVDKIYKQLLEAIPRGYKYIDLSRDVECTQMSNVQLSLDLVTMPFITTKKLYHKSVITELLWFLKGDTNIKYLLDNGCNIWNDDAYNAYKRACEYCDLENDLSLEDFLVKVRIGKPTMYSDYPYYGDVGRNYSAQWRDWRGVDAGGNIVHIDQISELFENLRKKKISRRHIVTAWNPAEISQTALPPCHWAWEVIPKPLRNHEKIEILVKQQGADEIYLNTLWKESTRVTTEPEAQVKVLEATAVLEAELSVEPSHGFTLKWHQRSTDTFLGLPFNAASYGVLAVFIQAVTDMQGLEIIGDLSNVHLYANSLEMAKKQAERNTSTYEGCGLTFSPELQQFIQDYKDGILTISGLIEMMQPEDFIVQQYNSHGPLKVEMLAPKE